MLILNSPQVVQETVTRWKKEAKLTFVPTMGGLHEGHRQLVKRAKLHGQKIVVSIFVNPLQFAPNEDFAHYPRTLAEDTEMLRDMEVDLLFTPTEKDLYPAGFATSVSVGKLSQHLCGKSRPGHFEGVATVCLKLFQITQPDFVVFGEKDFQQLRIIEQMCEDLNLPLTVIAHETVRDKDGLALSSRNRYLSPEQRECAAVLPKAMEEARDFLRVKAKATVGEVRDIVSRVILSTDMSIEYSEIASEEDLLPEDPRREILTMVKPRLFVALHLGSIRLIDNIALCVSNHEKTP